MHTRDQTHHGRYYTPTFITLKKEKAQQHALNQISRLRGTALKLQNPKKYSPLYVFYINTEKQGDTFGQGRGLLWIMVSCFLMLLSKNKSIQG